MLSLASGADKDPGFTPQANNGIEHKTINKYLIGVRIMTKRSNLKRLFLFNGILLLIAFILIQYSVVMHSPDTPQMEYKGELPKPIMEGIVAKRFELYPKPEPLPDLPIQSIMGAQLTFEDLRGQWVMLNFWATWCPPCLAEMPSLQKLQDDYGGQGVKVVAVSLDRNMTGDKLKEFMLKHKFGPVAGYFADGKEAMRLFGLRGLPKTYVLEPGGRAIGAITGDIDWGEDVARTFVDSLIGKNRSGQ